MEWIRRYIVRGFNIDPTTFDVWVNRGTTAKFDVLFDLNGYTEDDLPVKAGDIVYLVVRDPKAIDPNAYILRKTFPVTEITVTGNDGLIHRWAKFSFAISHLESKALPIGNFRWDFTYYTDGDIPLEFDGNGFPVNGTVVDTPFCEIVKPKFDVREIESYEQ